jgi:hypothetical protein
VIVGAWSYNAMFADEGAAFVYLGSASGLSTTPVWTKTGEEPGMIEYGFDVATAGDVNRDGFSDVMVGCPHFSNGEVVEGRVFVYLGNASGVASTPVWHFESDQDQAHAGYSVASAGDVNGDGYSDIILGAIVAQADQFQEGLAYGFHGSPSGPSVSPDWTAEGDQTSAFSGAGVSSAGDVNGDGYSDVIVGANAYDNGQNDEGIARVYLGGPSGLDFFPERTVESNQANAKLGYSSAETAGDVNGDGFGDLIVGAPLYDAGQTDEGAAFLYYGNMGDGLDRIPQQRRADDSAPIDLLGWSDSETSFRLRALGRTAAGRGRVRLEWEVKAPGSPFTGTGLSAGAFATTGAPQPGSGSTVVLAETVAGLFPSTRYKWRLREASNSPYFPRTPWLAYPCNAPTETDLRTKFYPVGVADPNGSARAILALEPNRPDPFRTVTRFAFTLPEAGPVRFAIHDVQGRLVATLVDREESAGRHVAAWEGRCDDGSTAAPGVYFARLETAGEVRSRKIVRVE